MEEHTTDRYGPKPELLWLDPQSLLVDDAYQRSTNSRRGRLIIGKIVDAFEWRKYGALSVSRDQEGNLLLVDGQHRTAAAIALGLPLVPACVSASNSVAEQAEAFVGINTDRTGISALQLYHSKLAAGDEVAELMQQAVTGAGVEILRTPRPWNQMKPNHTQAVSTIRKLVEAGGPERMSSILKMIMEAYPASCGLTDFIIRTVSLIAANAEHEVLLDPDFVELLATRSPERWQTAAKAEREDRRCPAAVAGRLVISREYNKGRRSNRLPMDW
tara:strand:+ start:8582 stop:9400 length:819 start_codon:yes stop_codon:yes gene_type:complete